VTGELNEQGWEVPDHRVEELRPKSHRFCVAVFVINEGEKLLAQLDKMRPLTDRVDVIVADGGSTDGSVGREKLTPRNVRSLLVKTGPGRLGAQMRIAFQYALREGYEGVVTMDGNNKDDPSAIPSFVDALKEGADYLQGSRFIEGGQAVRTPLMRLVAIRLVHAPLISLAAGFKYTDTTNGFRGYGRQLLADPQVAVFRNVFSGYELHYYLAIRAARLGYSVKEIPVTRTYPEKGPTPTKIRGLGGYLIVARDLFRACRHRFDPTEVEQRGKGATNA
jgi:glycosyltransferase involved in cell wall biosynthesis